MWRLINKDWDLGICTLVLIPYILPILYELKMETSIYRADIYLIWITGMICMLSRQRGLVPMDRRTIYTVLALTAYLIIILFVHPIDETSFYAVLTGLSYWSVILYLKKVGMEKSIYVLLLSFPAYLIQVVFGLYQLIDGKTVAMMIHGNLYNSGTFGNYLIYGIPILFMAAYSQMLDRTIRYTAAIICFASILLIIATTARAAALGTITSLLFVVIFFRRTERRMSELVLIGSLLIALAIFGLYHFSSKVDSLTGRMTIYKVSWEIICDHWLIGVGPDRFRTVFNLYQAEYLHQSGVSIHQRAVADNTFEAFNFILQIWAEYGLLGISISTLFIIRTIRALHKIERQAKINKRVMQACVGSMVGILVAGMFSNPFHSSPIAIFFCYNLGFVIALIKEYPSGQRNRYEPFSNNHRHQLSTRLSAESKALELNNILESKS